MRRLGCAEKTRWGRRQPPPQNLLYNADVQRQEQEAFAEEDFLEAADYDLE